MKTRHWTEFLALAAATAAEANSALGAFGYTGGVMDYKHELYTSADRLTVQAVAADGTILASAKVVDSVESTGANYRLEVPVSSGATGKSTALKTFIEGLDTDKGGQIDVPGVSDIELRFRSYSRSEN